MPGFSERTFEFCYNSEYCQINKSILATHPHIPSQRAEKHLGYDVEFEYKKNQYTGSLFLQHKISSHARKLSGNNAHFFNAQSGPYFRFLVDNHQHNILCELSKNKGNVFYCAPIFHHHHELEKNYRHNSITSNVILLNPLDIGTIDDDDRHNITYNEHGKNATLHSEVRRFKESFGGSKENAPHLKRQEVTEEYIENFIQDLIRVTEKSKYKSAINTAFDRAKPIEKIQILLGHVYKVSWLLLP